MHFDGPPKPVGDRTLRLAALVCAVILTLAALSLARSVMTPVAFALFVIALVWPLQRQLKKKLPRLVAVFQPIAYTADIGILQSDMRNRIPIDNPQQRQSCLASFDRYAGS